MTAATSRAMGSGPAAAFAREAAILERMTEAAESSRGKADAKIRYVLSWIRENPDKRVVIFTEYADTKRYIERHLRAALTPNREDDPRIATFHGGMVDEAREDVKRAFNADPAKNPLRILIATDAAREGVNLQNHCANLFHFDVPWNPSRLEQRNGRIDRKLQQADFVYCRYFVYSQRPEDRVIRALVEKTKTIRKQLGSLAPVLERRLEDKLATGFSRKDAAALAAAIEGESLDPEKQDAARRELEDTRQREKELKKQIFELEGLLGRSKEWLHLDAEDLEQTISSGLELIGAKPLAENADHKTFAIPDSTRFESDPAWVATLDTLRAPRKNGQPEWQWRRENPIRSVVFQDQGTLDSPSVHLHLEHRFVQRLLGRFRSQGFVHNELARACIGVTDDPIARVVLLGRLSLYGDKAARLHDEILAVAARWSDVEIRTEPLKAYSDSTLDKTLTLLEQALSRPNPPVLPEAVRQRLAAGAHRDLEELKPLLAAQAAAETAKAAASLTARGAQEAIELRGIIEAQRARIVKTAADLEKPQALLPFDPSELRQIDSNKRHWTRRLEELAVEIETGPARIRTSYQVKATRFEPAGLVYLWPITG
jgi:hypothetical protein